MKKIIISTLIIIISQIAFADNYTGLKEYYSVYSSKSIEKIDKMLLKLKNYKSTSKIRAYKGALLMKKASLIKIPAKKIELFKKGKNLLEKEIKLHKNNVEYRFLRLSVQENAPKILKYSNNIIEDKNIIKANFKKQNKIFKKIIIDYSKTSKTLKL